MLLLEREDETSDSETFSGSVTMTYSQLAIDTYGLQPDAVALSAIFCNVYLYVRERATAKVWMVDFSKIPPV